LGVGVSPIPDGFGVDADVVGDLAPREAAEGEVDGTDLSGAEVEGGVDDFRILPKLSGF
jgi:hypothetical protein